MRGEIKKERGTVEAARVVFSERGGHDYSHLRSYIETLRMQGSAGTTFLKTREIVSDVLLPELCEVRSHTTLAGLQLADIAASAFFQGIDSLLPTYNPSNAIELKKRVACAPGTKKHADFGLLRLPFKKHGEIPIADRPIFEAFGYDWEG
ncbi:hypothetical protein QP179_10665 [Sphingomonas aurantiaca]|uniref:hypothetical protein n=1 Tax=Sphingomonas aurantiaca TaxID=185949 RepID=UPI002FE1FBDF